MCRIRCGCSCVKEIFKFRASKRQELLLWHVGIVTSCRYLELLYVYLFRYFTRIRLTAFIKIVCCWCVNTVERCYTNLSRLQTIHTVEDLQPATRYSMKVTAYSDAGSTEVNILFATLTYTGGMANVLFVHRLYISFWGILNKPSFEE